MEKKIYLDTSYNLSGFFNPHYKHVPGTAQGDAFSLKFIIPLLQVVLLRHG